MTPDDTRLQAAVAAAERRIWSMLWDVAPSRRSQVAEAAVRAALPHLAVTSSGDAPVQADTLRT